MIAYYTGQSKEIADIFHEAIHQTAADSYSAEQLAAWAPAPIDYAYWKSRCELTRPFLFEKDGRVAGFIELDSDGHIECHYVHPDFNRQGIGGQLLRHVISVAGFLQYKRVNVEASHVAKGLYLKHGFEVVLKNTVTRRGVELDNWVMEKK